MALTTLQNWTAISDLLDSIDTEINPIEYHELNGVSDMAIYAQKMQIVENLREAVNTLRSEVAYANLWLSRV